MFIVVKLDSLLSYPSICIVNIVKKNVTAFVNNIYEICCSIFLILIIYPEYWMNVVKNKLKTDIKKSTKLLLLSRSLVPNKQM